MRASLAREMAEFLNAHGPATVKDLARGVRARRADVAALLLVGGFERAARPEGAHPHAVYYVVSRRVPSRADAMYEVLADGQPHSREAIFARAGRWFNTNNAARELRGRGLDVAYDRKSDSYRLLSLAESETEGADGPAARSSSASGSAGERTAA